MLLLFFVSGFSGLILEMTWARRLSLLTGNGVQATAAVVAITIAGLALGARWAGRRADGSPRPLLCYALLETGVSFWAFATPQLFRLLPGFASLLRFGQHPRADLGPESFLATAVLLLPGTILMGGSTPYLVRHASRHWPLPAASPARRHGGIFLGSLYGWNTLGGAAGALSAVFLLLPRLGIGRTILAAGSLDLAVAGAVFLLPWRETAGEDNLADRRPPASPLSRSAPRGHRLRVLGALAAAGALGGVCQLVWTRLLVLFFGSSTHAIGITLAACLTGLAVGSAWAGKRLEHGSSSHGVTRTALLIFSGATSLSLPVWGRAPALIVMVMGRLGASFTGALILQGLLSLLLLFPAAFALGALLPALTSLLGGGIPAAGRDSGDGFSLDSWGTAGGALGAAFLLLPGVGAEGTLRLAGMVSVALLIGAPRDPSPSSRRLPRPPRLLFPGACLLCLLLLPRWDPELMTSGPLLYASSYGRQGVGFTSVEEAMRRRGTLRFLEEGPEATVTVREGAGGILSLQINGKTDASSGPDLPTQLLAGRLPALLHPSPRRALVIGLASGATAGALLSKTVERVDCAEISPEVSRAAQLFAAVNGQVTQDPRFHLHLGDGRVYLEQAGGPYDLITSQPTNPWIAGVTNLFTREFFQLARDRLAERGVLAIWLQGYALAPEDFRSAVATFLEVFPEAELWEESAAGGDFFLVGWKSGGPPALEALKRKLGALPDIDSIRSPGGLEDLAGFLSRFVAGSRGLARYSRGAPVVSDDNLRLEFSAPRALWEYRMPELIAGLEEIREPSLEYFAPLPPSEEDDLKTRLRELDSRRAGRIRLALSLRRADYEALSSPELSAVAALVRKGLTDAALPLLQEARRRSPGAPALALLEGWIRMGRGEYGEAEQRFHEARSLDPLSSEAANGEGMAAWRSGDSVLAKSLFLAAWELSPDDPEPANNAASLLLSEGSEEAALPLLRRVLERHPRYVPARINLGVALARLGRLDEAKASYLEALKLDPGNPDAAYNLKRVEERFREKGN